MDRTIVGFLLLIGLLILFPPYFSSAQQTTMCISQFALANQACGVLPSELALRGRNSSRSKADDSDSGTSDDDDDDDNDDDDEDDDGVDNSNDDSDDNDDGDGESERRRKRRHKRDRGDKKKGHKHEKHGGKRGRGHGHKHGGGHEDDEPRANKDCCRWLEELDESCVCSALLRLPPFLVKPNHEYSIKVGKSCKFSYSCYGI